MLTTEFDNGRLTAEEVLAVAIEGLARARNDLDSICKLWHREREDDTLRGCVKNLDIAGMALVALREAINPKVEGDRGKEN